VTGRHRLDAAGVPRIVRRTSATLTYAGRHRVPAARRAPLRDRLQGWLPAGSASRRLLVIFFVDSVGTGLFLAGSALFFTRAMGLTAGQVGVGLSLSGVVGLVCTIPFGKLADRFGSRRTLILLFLWRGLGFLAYVLVDGFMSFVAVACFLGAAEWAVGPVMQAIVGAAEEGDSRVRTMGAVTAVRNAGFMIGAVLATLLIASDSVAAYRGLVLVDAASFFVAAALLSRIRLVERVDEPAEPVERVVRVRDVTFLLLAAGNGVLRLHMVLLSVGLPLWITTRTEAPATLVGAVVTVNTLLAITLGVHLSRGVEGVRAGAGRQHWSGWCLAACCALVALTAGVDSVLVSALLLAAAVVLTLGEVWQSVGAWALSFALSPEDQRNYYLAVYKLGEPVAATIGPALLTIAVIDAGSGGWLSLGAVFAATGVAVRLIATSRPRPARPGARHALSPHLSGPAPRRATYAVADQA
jgi:MFS family permease